MNAKTFFVLSAFSFLALTVRSQEIYQVGITAGSNYASLRSDLFSTGAGRLGPALGCSFIVGFNEYFELNQEIVFVQKGASAKAVYFRPEDTPEQMAYEYFYNSFEVGLFAGVSPWRTIPITLQAGGFLGTHSHKLDRSAREVYIGDYENINYAKPALGLNDAFSGVDMGPALGISGGKGRFRVTARYYFGARNLYNNLDFVEEGHRIRTSSLRLSMACFLK